MIVVSIKVEPIVVPNPKGPTPATNILPPLNHISCIYYLVRFKKDQVETQTLIDSSSEVNAITWSYATMLGLKIHSTFKTFGIVLATFQVENKLKKARFFLETFLKANTHVNIILEMPFFTLSNIDVGFNDWELTWRSYTLAKVLLITKQNTNGQLKRIHSNSSRSNQKSFCSLCGLLWREDVNTSSLKSLNSFIGSQKYGYPG